MNRGTFHFARTLWALFVFASIPTVCQAQAKPGAAIAAQLAWSGDDGLTTRFKAALESALKSSQEFDISRNTAKERLRLFIPRNLYGAEAKGRLNFQYVVILTNQDSKYLGVSIGSCWAEEAEVAECAQTVLKEAADAWKRRFDPQVWPR
jgi:hypothetical protein